MRSLRMVKTAIRFLHFLVVASAPLLVLSGCGSGRSQPPCQTCTLQVQGFVYAATQTGQVQVLPVAANGSLGAPASLAGPQVPGGIAVSHSTHELFLSDHIFNNLYAFNDVANQYSPVQGSPFPLTSSTGFFESVAIRPDGKFAYVIGLSGGITGLSIAANGSVAPISGSPFPAPTNSVAAVTDSAGTFLFVVSSSAISVFTIDSASGTLTTTGAPVSLPGATLSTAGMAAVTPSPGNFIYIALAGANSLAAFSFDATGTLKPVNGSPFAVGAGPLNITATPSTVYAMNSLDNTISALAWDSATGALTQINGSPFSAQGGSGDLASLHDEFLYIPNPSANAIVGFSITPGGALTPLPGSPFPAGAQPRGVLAAF
jgi:6-phosphogluconolactonase